jgi:CheY-like chemotaxis protein/anti-sigma regulatory factor (Ser/Thr protein kinase)
MPKTLEAPSTERVLSAPETRVLIVDDSPIDRRLAGRMVEKSAGWTVLYASDGREALALLERETPAVILTDLQMPEIDGLELVKEVRGRYPSVPVVLMTAHGSEEIAILALQAGAASYVPKRSLATELVHTLDQVLSLAAADRTRQRLLSSLVRHESFFRLENDPDLIGPLVDRFLHELAGMEIGDATTRLRIGVAVHESLANALYHGNLEVSSDLRQEDERRFYDLAEQRRGLDPYQARRIEVCSILDRSGASFVIRDQGPGFDVAALDRPIDPEDLMRIGGRGLLLIRAFMDEVSHNAQGNEIRLVKRQKTTP